MKQNQKSRQGKTAKTGEKKNQAKPDSSKVVRKNEYVSIGDSPEEPVIPAVPKREYEDPGHEHVYQPPRANPSSTVSIYGYIGSC